MKNLLISISAAVLLAANGAVTYADSLTVPKTFTAGTKAIAADVNANFAAVAASVNDNDSRITTNTGEISNNTAATAANAAAISTNATNIGNNTTAINNNAAAITANAAAISTNATNIANNTTAINNNAAAIIANSTATATNSTAIAALQSANQCPSDMVAAGSLCVDKYEASVWDAPTSPTTRYGLNVDDYPCNNDGSDCGVGAPAAFPIYARSVAGVVPSSDITLYQAAQACANVGKRLPTTTEWLMAASGTPSGTGDGTTGCNSNTGNLLGPTGNAPSCKSSAGAFDMVGNLWEWVADLQSTAATAGTVTDTDTLIARALGDDNVNSGGGTPSIKKMIVLDNSNGLVGLDHGPNSSIFELIGFRCVR